MDFTNRLIQIVDYQSNGNKRNFSKITGIPYSTLIEYLNGTKKDPKLSLLSKIKNVNAFWLLTGKGEMLEKEQKSSSRFDTDNNRSILKTQSQGSAINTLIADAAVSIGFESFLDKPGKLEELPGVSLPCAPSGLNIAFQINGDSMYGTINHLDFVAANKVEDIAHIREGHVYILIDKEEGALCKRVYFHGDDFKIVSDNPNYPPYIRSRHGIAAFFRAFCRLSFDFRSYNTDIRNAIHELQTKIQHVEQHINTKS